MKDKLTGDRTQIDDGWILEFQQLAKELAHIAEELQQILKSDVVNLKQAELLKNKLVTTYHKLLLVVPLDVSDAFISTAREGILDFAGEALDKSVIAEIIAEFTIPTV